MNILASQRFQFKMLSVDGLAWWCFLDNSCGALSLIDWPVPQFCSATSETQAAGPEHEIIDVDNDSGAGCCTFVWCCVQMVKNELCIAIKEYALPIFQVPFTSGFLIF